MRVFFDGRRHKIHLSHNRCYHHNLKVAGSIYSESMYSAGLACFVDGAKTTTVIGCHVSILLSGSYKVHDCANFGGFVALVKSTSYEPLVFRNCSFQGYLASDFTAGSACFVGFTRVPVSIEHCMVDPKSVFQGILNTATCQTYCRRL